MLLRLQPATRLRALLTKRGPRAQDPKQPRRRLRCEYVRRTGPPAGHCHQVEEGDAEEECHAQHPLRRREGRCARPGPELVGLALVNSSCGYMQVTLLLSCLLGRCLLGRCLLRCLPPRRLEITLLLLLHKRPARRIRQLPPCTLLAQRCTPGAAGACSALRLVLPMCAGSQGEPPVPSAW